MAHFVRWLALASVAALTLFDFALSHFQTHLGSVTPSRKLFVENGRRLLKNCIKSQAGQVLKKRAITRRLAILNDIYAARRLDAATALSTDHESCRTGFTSNTSSSELFTGEPACLLEPKVTEGPYYVAGELIRLDIREDQPGIDLYVDLQFIDVNTCSPVNELYVDFWHANASGAYSGVVARTNGSSDDASNIGTTFHRGLSPTDSDGFVSFTTKFPGLYTGRATHIHIMTHSGGTVILANGTYSGGRVSHVGQLFFDQSLITEVQATGVYADNSNPVTTNEDDSIATVWLQFRRRRTPSEPANRVLVDLLQRYLSTQSLHESVIHVSNVLVRLECVVRVLAPLDDFIATIVADVATTRIDSLKLILQFSIRHDVHIVCCHSDTGVGIAFLTLNVLHTFTAVRTSTVAVVRVVTSRVVGLRNRQETLERTHDQLVVRLLQLAIRVWLEVAVRAEHHRYRVG